MANADKATVDAIALDEQALIDRWIDRYRQLLHRMLDVLELPGKHHAAREASQGVLS